jgi:hypothetical protein
MASRKTLADKQVALERFDQLYKIMMDAFAHPELGSHGQRAIEERKPGGIYDSTAAYRVPIEQSSVTSDSDAWADYLGVSGGGSNLLLMGGLALVAVALIME